MKVIKHGDMYEEVECDKCKALIGYAKKDVNSYYTFVENTGKSNYVLREFIDCPECNYRIILGEKK